MNVSGCYRVACAPLLAGISPTEWNALLEPDDAPLLSWEYLHGLEATGCVGEDTGWLPFHILIFKLPHPREKTGPLVAAAPAYIKFHSDGEWVWDGEWPTFSAQVGVDYYPRLVLAAPWNPVTGGRLLVLPSLPEEERAALRASLLQASKQLCKRLNLSSVHALFVRGCERDVSQNESVEKPGRAEVSDQVASCILEEFLPRRQTQYHFHNQNYRSFEDFLTDLRSHRRNTIRRERRELADAGIIVTTHVGLCKDETAPVAEQGRPRGFFGSELDFVFDLYEDTSKRHTGEKPYLNRAFFHLCAQTLGNRVELVLAKNRDGEVLAGAWNLRGDTRRFGRYWGSRVAMPFLHFETCFYHPIEQCISDGISVFEPGHGGDQKLLRGFRPTYTYSAHWFAHPRLHQIISVYLDHEARAVDAIREFEQVRCPIRFLGHETKKGGC
ncbi:MAG TPA: GNAT family N-acetyltransferase [Pseudomonadota bacterium]|nr:GNAT family N-acetyltransferase [Pseudomonadota bacterium]